MESVKRKTKDRRQSLNREIPKDQSGYLKEQTRLETTLIIITLLGLFIIMLGLRIIPFYADVFTNWLGPHGNFVNFAPDDPVYHMRLVHNTLEHFPFRVFFDPFTHFPYGTQIHFGPLWTLLIAAVSLILGLGHPSAELVDYVGAFFPVFFGALCLIPVYFIAKKLFGKTAAIFSATIFAFLPGAFFDRSRLGYTDHHIGEVFFSTLSMMFLTYALPLAKKSNITFSAFKKKLTPTRKLFLTYILLAGFCNGLYLLVWPAALLFSVILFLFFIAQIAIEHIKNKPTNYLIITSIPFYLLPMLMVIPYALTDPELKFDIYYSLSQPTVISLILIILICAYALSKLTNKYRLPKIAYPLALCGMFLCIGLTIHLLYPKLSEIIVGGCKMLFHPVKEMSTVAEAVPILFAGSPKKISISLLWQNFYWTLPVTLAGIAILGYRAYKHKIAKELLLFVWSICIFFAMLAQNRFAYYFAINVALLSGFVIYLAFKFLGAREYQKALMKKAKNFKELLKFIKQNDFKTTMIAITLLYFIYIATQPLFANGSSASLLFHKVFNRQTQIAKINPAWIQALLWMREHTPDPQGENKFKDFDFKYGNYKIPNNPEKIYYYPKSAYGVMSWWDYGHLITYLAERIPNANPFQEGILEENNTAGATLFFISTSENEAIKNLEKLKSRYVIICNDMANGQFPNIAYWSNREQDRNGWRKRITVPVDVHNISKAHIYVDSEKFQNSMINKLYYDDGDKLQHFRLIYESGGHYIVDVDCMNIVKKNVFFSHLQLLENNYERAQKIAKQGKNFSAVNKRKTSFIYNSRPAVKYLKIFEKVKGAKIFGRAPSGKSVNLTLFLMTENKRAFTYSQITKAKDGKYSFIVPYPTEKMQGKDYSYNITPISKYLLYTDKEKQEISIPEKAILNGGNIEIAIH